MKLANDAALFLLDALVDTTVRLKEAQAENEKLKIDPSLRRELDAAQAVNKSMADQLGMAARSRQKLQAELDVAENDKEALRREIDRLLSGQTTRYDEEIEACKAERNAYSLRVDDLEGMVAKLCDAGREFVRGSDDKSRRTRFVLRRRMVDAIREAGR